MTIKFETPDGKLYSIKELIPKVETMTGERLTLPQDIKKNWQQNKNLIIAILVAFGVWIAIQMLSCAMQILDIGNGDTFLYFLKTIIGETGLVLTIITFLLTGINVGSFTEWLKNNNKKIVDADHDGIPDDEETDTDEEIDP